VKPSNANEFVGRPDLIKKGNWTTRNVLDLFQATFHLFKFNDVISEKSKRRYESIAWKSYYNILLKRKWRLLGEQAASAEEQTR